MGIHRQTYSADLKNAASALLALDAAEKALGPLDVLVNSAGAAKRAAAPDLKPEVWRDAMDSKFFTYINMNYTTMACAAPSIVRMVPVT